MKASLQESKAKLSEYVKRAAAGEEIVITVHGHPRVMLCPVMDETSPFTSEEFAQELADIRKQYSVKDGASMTSERIVSDFREERV